MMYKNDRYDRRTLTEAFASMLPGVVMVKHCTSPRAQTKSDLGGGRTANLISESRLYELTMRSDEGSAHRPGPNIRAKRSVR